MWRKYRLRFSLKINWILRKMSDKKSLSIQREEILMEQIRTYSLYDKCKISYKEHGVNRKAWSKVAEKLHFMQNGIYKCRVEELG